MKILKRGLGDPGLKLQEYKRTNEYFFYYNEIENKRIYELVLFRFHKRERVGLLKMATATVIYKSRLLGKLLYSMASQLFPRDVFYSIKTRQRITNETIIIIS